MVIISYIVLGLCLLNLIGVVVVLLKLQKEIRGVTGQLAAHRELAAAEHVKLVYLVHDLVQQEKLTAAAASLYEAVAKVETAAAAAQKVLVPAAVQLTPQYIKEHAADLGIALAERMSRLQRGPKGEKRLAGSDKVKIAVDYALEHALDMGMTVAPAEMRKTVEVRLELVQAK